MTGKFIVSYAQISDALGLGSARITRIHPSGERGLCVAEVEGGNVPSPGPLGYVAPKYSVVNGLALVVREWKAE